MAQNKIRNAAAQIKGTGQQRDKIVAALAAIDGDVVGMTEIENNVTDVHRGPGQRAK